MSSESSNQKKYSPVEIIMGILFWGMIGAFVVGLISEQFGSKDDGRKIYTPYSGGSNSGGGSDDGIDYCYQGPFGYECG
jgi:hypothetical protein